MYTLMQAWMHGCMAGVRYVYISAPAELCLFVCSQDPRIGLETTPSEQANYTIKDESPSSRSSGIPSCPPLLHERR